jgi:hypothetical protein
MIGSKRWIDLKKKAFVEEVVKVGKRGNAPSVWKPSMTLSWLLTPWVHSRMGYFLVHQSMVHPNMCSRVPELTKVYSRTFKFPSTLVRQCTDAPIIPPIRTEYSTDNEYRNQRRSCRNPRTSPGNVSSIRQSNVIQPVHCLQAHDYVLNGPFVPSLMQWNCALSCKAARLEYLPKQGVYRYLTVLGSLTQASDLPKLMQWS